MKLLKNKFNQNKSPGHDGIRNSIVKKVASTISKPLTDIFIVPW